MNQSDTDFFSYPTLQVVDEMPFCQRCRCTLPRSTNDPCRDPQCPLGNMSLIALWNIIEGHPPIQHVQAA